RSEVDLDNMVAVDAFCQKLDIEVEMIADRQSVRANGVDITGYIRTPEMSLLTSRISSLKPVRDALLKSQRLMGLRGGVVLEGRDIGTVVFPDADIKFFLSASVEERARRRCEELSHNGVSVSLDETIADVIRRDRQDSERDIAPLRQAEDAIAIDSSQLSIEDVLDHMTAICHTKIDAMEHVS
ncbi:MAG: (d)CMP kinase, partial [bacterium]|nr:(d)CMP kinase [bacterium]